MRTDIYHAIKELCVDRGKLAILATHQHQFTGDSTCILMMEGRMKCLGAYSACVNASEGKLKASMHTSEHDAPKSRKQSDSAKAIVRRASSLGKTTARVSQTSGNVSGVVKEDRNTGIIKLSTWK